jgi:hypothetical protein
MLGHTLDVYLFQFSQHVFNDILDVYLFQCSQHVCNVVSLIL